MKSMVACLLALSTAPLALAQAAPAPTPPIPVRAALGAPVEADTAIENTPTQKPAKLPDQLSAVNNSAGNTGLGNLWRAVPANTRMWADTEALLWWVKSAPVAVPTLTTYAPGSLSEKTGFGGELGVAGTTVLSPDHLGYNPFVGGRVNLGGWLDGEQRIGLEVGGFLLERTTASSTIFSSPAGSPALRIPFFNVPPGAAFPLGESSFVLADPKFAAGGQVLNSSLHFWGAEANALLHVVNGPRFDVSLLGGFRYLDLHEDLSITSNETVLGVASFSGTDVFTTRNQFYGGQFGVKAEGDFGRFYTSLIAKLALGNDHQAVTINGFNTVTGGFGLPAGTTPGGIFAQSTNIGQRYRNEFCAVPEVQLKLGYNVSPRLRVFVSYDFLYMSDVVRPGSQIDRTLNLTSSGSISGVIPPTLIGAARPEPLFNGSSFWAQGVSVGFQFKF